MLLALPWWMLAIGSAASYLIFHNILPATFAANPFLGIVVMMIRGLAWVPALLLAFFAVLSYLRERRQQADARLDPVRNEPAMRLRPAKAPSQPARKAMGGDAPNATRDATTPQQAPTQAQATAPQSWTLEAIKSLEWKRFELLCVQYYEQMGFTVKTVPHGPDGGIDATLYKAGLDAPVAVVQCKAWAKPVKVEQVRALGGSMLAHKVKRGVFWSLSGYVGNPVQEFSESAGIQLLDGPAILERIRALDPAKQAALLAKVFEGDYRTPSCPACGVKLVVRQGKGTPVWRCTNSSAGCRYTLRMARAA
ncbi:restriction endonuclease [Ralstonia sp. 24A2]|uniref:restriction endonuclease n=1 Tax=Ralstonia sp. 24A2 TaxID=3447364 RepID=UPI003F69FF6D